jgi:hypothetical protein
MKHFTQFVHLLRTTWEGDRQKAAEQVMALADQMDGEGDAAHARMLRFTLQSLQNRPLSQSAMAAPAQPARSATATASPARAPLAEPAAPTVALTFGTWDETQH